MPDDRWQLFEVPLSHKGVAFIRRPLLNNKRESAIFTPRQACMRSSLLSPQACASASGLFYSDALINQH